MMEMTMSVQPQPDIGVKGYQDLPTYRRNPNVYAPTVKDVGDLVFVGNQTMEYYKDENGHLRTRVYQRPRTPTRERSRNPH